MLATLLALPTWLKAMIAGVALVGVLQVRHWWVVRGFERQIAAITQERDEAQRQVSELRVAVADVSANRDMLAGRLREQSRAIELLQTRAKQAESAAALAATRAIAAGREASESLRSPTSTIPPGHVEMNAWLQAQFASTP